MKVYQLFEAIEAPLYRIGLESIDRAIQEWTPEAMKVIDQYSDKAQYTNQYSQHQKINVDPMDSKTANQHYDAMSNLRDNQYQREYNILFQEQNAGLDSFLTKTFKEALEKAFREAAVGHMEAQFGKVERYAPKTPWEDVEKLNLGFLQYVAVHIDTEDTYPKSGNPRTGGGYFTRMPNKNTFTDKWSQENVDWQNDLGFGIKLRAKAEELLLSAKEILRYQIATDHYGEAEPNHEFASLLKVMLPLWVHETVHLEQTVRRHRLGKKYYKYDWGMSHTPQNKKRPKYDPTPGLYDDPKQPRKKTRGGNRGFPSHLTDIENVSPEDWLEYFGTVHEIEAYAAGAAAEIMHDIMANLRPDYSGQYPQSDINYNVDSAIKDITAGYAPDSHSYQTYQDELKNKASRLLRMRAWKDERQLNKINIGWRKAWTLFMHKLVKHLQAYTKPGKNWDRDPRFRLPAPANPPALPTDDASNYNTAAEFGPMKYGNKPPG